MNCRFTSKNQRTVCCKVMILIWCLNVLHDLNLLLNPVLTKPFIFKMFFVMCVLWLCKSLPLLSPQTNQFVVIVTFLPRPAIILSHVELRPAAIFPCQFYGAMIHIRNSKVVVPVDAMKPYREGRCMAPLILKSGARC